MKELLKDSAPVGKLLAGTSITGVVKSINPPPADDITKQPITLMYPGDEGLELRCNIMGVHLHLTPDKAGKVITLTAENDSTFYVSKFDDGRFLTIRDGVRFQFREPKPGTVPTVDDRIKVLADHYRKCRTTVAIALGADIKEFDAEAVEVAMAIFMDTKSQATVKKAVVPLTEAEPLPDTPMPEEEPADWDDTIEHLAGNLVSLPFATFLPKAGKAVSYGGTDRDKLKFRAAFIKATDLRKESDPSIWSKVLNAAYESHNDADKILIDVILEEAVAKHPGAPTVSIDEATCLMLPQLLAVRKQDV